MSLSGEALPFFMSTAYTITGALMGTAPGGEFIAADEAARAIGAQARRLAAFSSRPCGMQP